MPSKNIKWKLDTKELDRIIKDADTNADKIARHLAFKGEGYAKQEAAVDKSAMRNSIYTVTSKEDNYQTASQAAKSANPEVKTAPIPKPEKGQARFGPCVDYGLYQEFGTSKMDPHPFMTPAVERLRKEFKDGATYREMVNK